MPRKFIEAEKKVDTKKANCMAYLFKIFNNIALITTLINKENKYKEKNFKIESLKRDLFSKVKILLAKYANKVPIIKLNVLDELKFITLVFIKNK